ncbi:MAG: beta/gamma crystallin-related protein [Rhizobiaceae bacterium]
MFICFAQLFKAIVLIDRKRIGVISIILIGACTIPVTNASAAGCEPGPKEVSFFQHPNYEGACSVLGVGKYPNSKAMRIKNDTISSFKVGSQVTVTVCKHATKGTVTNRFFSDPQKCQTHKKSNGFIKYNRVGDNSISSAMVLPRFGGYTGTTNGACKPSPGQEAVAVYQHPNYKGRCQLLTLGTYNNARAMRFKNDSISSIEFSTPSNVEIYANQHNNQQGRGMTLHESMSNLKNSSVGDNAISSVTVRRKN